MAKKKKLTDAEKVKIYEKISQLELEKYRWTWDDPFTSEPMYYHENQCACVKEINRLKKMLNY